MITEKQVFAALPRAGFLRSYVDWAARWVEANLAFHVPAALALLSQTAPVDLQFPGVTPMSANFYALLVGPSSSSGKTRSIEAAKSVLKLARPESIMVKPGSPEACVDALNGTPQIILYDEFGSFLQSSRQGQLAPLRSVFMDLYDCGEAGRNLVGGRKKPKPPEPNPRLSILGGVAPTLLEDYTEETEWTGGFLARFFTVYASVERRIPYLAFEEGAKDRAVLAATLAEYAARFDAFTSLQPCRGFTTGATNLWESWRTKMRKRAQKAEEMIAGAMHRSQGHALKIALLLAWDYGQAQSGTQWYVDVDALEPALAFIELHMISVEEIAEGLAASPDMKDQRRMYRAIGEEPITFGQAIKKAHLTKRRGEEMISTLLEKGMIIRITNDFDITEPVKYAHKKGNVIPFPGSPKEEEVEEVEEAPDPFS